MRGMWVTGGIYKVKGIFFFLGRENLEHFKMLKRRLKKMVRLNIEQNKIIASSGLL